MATLQAESGGRAWLGIARGDSALAYLGRPPMPLAAFESGLDHTQRYLRGDVVDCLGFPSRIEWLTHVNVPKVPVSVSATGPRVIEIAARLADAITFSVGADPARLRSAIELAQRARRQADLPPLRLGAYINAVAHPDIRVARQWVRGRLATYARFSALSHSLDETDPRAAEALTRDYDIHGHSASGARHARALDDEFIDRFGVVGPSERVAERLLELIELGLDHVVVVGHGRNTPPEVFRESSRRFCEEVIPRLQKHAVA
jgi:5,10-methylenetetrahydromethanopterin reductase